MREAEDWHEEQAKESKNKFQRPCQAVAVTTTAEADLIPGRDRGGDNHGNSRFDSCSGGYGSSRYGGSRDNYTAAADLIPGRDHGAAAAGLIPTAEAMVVADMVAPGITTAAVRVKVVISYNS
ncbi:hypothetical protein NDU88_009270 [Pleurodeles waltl]|uniref:Uncharacterized protein n=1 Tax=Pleurodeles waltl TaxID=8319 RepID=A0AAV7RY17_PLEWA|nr:hypothetical protein NDU88_009270 [Pleurodeles waltl]